MPLRALIYSLLVIKLELKKCNYIIKKRLIKKIKVKESLDLLSLLPTCPNKV
jgi:hypothetical protein